MDQSIVKRSRGLLEVYRKTRESVGSRSIVLSSLTRNNLAGSTPSAIDGKVLGIDKLSITQTDSRDHLGDILGPAPTLKQRFLASSLSPSL
jgi:hypothetical protein